MTYIQQLLANRILLAGLTGWASAQIIKTILYAVINRSLNLERLVGDGGMPSGHSATVTCVALSTGIECGFASPVFAVAFILAVIVMHDAMGVRRQAGKHAKAINEMAQIIAEMSASQTTPEQKLKEFIGHSPIQVAAGFCLGVIVIVVLYM